VTVLLGSSAAGTNAANSNISGTSFAVRPRTFNAIPFIGGGL
jgi:hypothetical protein